MMQKSYLNYLISESKKFAKKNKVFGIILYGSSVKGKDKPRDIDILVIFDGIEFNKRVEAAYEFKQILIKKIKNLDVKSIELKDLFNKNFLARQSVLIEGYSLIDNMPLAKKFGFNGFVLFSYNLKNLDHNRKTKFVYALIGRKRAGVVKQIGALALGRGVFLVPIEKSLIFEELLKKWDINYKQKKILVSELR